MLKKEKKNDEIYEALPIDANIQKPIGFTLWEPWTSVQNVYVIQFLSMYFFHNWSTDWRTSFSPVSHHLKSSTRHFINVAVDRCTTLVKWWRFMTRFKRPETSIVWWSITALILSTLALQFETPIWRRTLYLVCAVGVGVVDNISCVMICCYGATLASIPFALAANLSMIPPKEFNQTIAFISNALMTEKRHRRLLLFDVYFFQLSYLLPSISENV